MPAKTTRPRTYLEAWRTRIRPHLARLRRAKRRLRLPRFVTIGYFCDIDPTVRFMPHNGARIVIGDWVRIRRYGELLGPVTIGSRTRINRDVYIRPNTTIGRDVIWRLKGDLERALVDQDSEPGASLSPDEMVCMLGLVESGAEELRVLLDRGQ